MIQTLPCSPPLFDSIRTGQRETRNSGPEARRTLAVIQTAIESSTTGQVVFHRAGNGKWALRMMQELLHSGSFRLTWPLADGDGPRPRAIPEIPREGYLR